MKSIRSIISLTILPFIMFSFSQCSSQKKLQDKAPVQLMEVYCQSWVAGVRGGGAGINIFIPTNLKTYNHNRLDSVYFRGKSAKLQIIEDKTIVYVGRFISDVNRKQDLIMSSDKKEEYGNKMLKVEEEIPFELKDDECIVSYKVGARTKYFKIKNIVEKASIPYPSAPPNKQ